MDEQKRIADILWAADDAVEAWRTVVGNLELTKNQILKNVFVPEVVENGVSKLSKLKDVAVLQTGIAKGRKYTNGEDVVELPYLCVANVKDGYLDLHEVKTISISRREVERYLVQSGDVLLTEGGDFDKLGRGTVWKGQIDNCLHQNHVFCVRVNAGVLLPEFLSYQTASPYGKSYFLKCAKKTSNLASINSTQVKNFPIILPPIIEQERIVGIIKTIEDELSNTQNQMQLLQSFIKKYLAMIVNGDVTYV